MLCRGSSADCSEGNRYENSNFFLRTKLKLMSYYEVMRTEEKVAFTFGAYAKVTNRWLWEVNMNMLRYFILQRFFVNKRFVFLVFHTVHHVYDVLA